MKILPEVIIWTFLAPNWSFFLYACFRGVFGVGGKEWALDEEKRNSYLYTSLWKEEEVGFDNVQMEFEAAVGVDSCSLLA